MQTVKIKGEIHTIRRTLTAYEAVRRMIDGKPIQDDEMIVYCDVKIRKLPTPKFDKLFPKP